MRLDCVIALSIASMLVLAGTAMAQQPAPSPAPPGPPADYGTPITNEQAKGVAAAAFAEAKKNNWRMAFAIVGPAGELVYFEKMEGAHRGAVPPAEQGLRGPVCRGQYRLHDISGETRGLRRRASHRRERQNHRRDRREWRHRPARWHSGGRRRERGEIGA